MKLMPEIEEACRQELGDKCAAQTKEGEVSCYMKLYRSSSVIRHSCKALNACHCRYTRLKPSRDVVPEKYALA